MRSEEFRGAMQPFATYQQILREKLHAFLRELPPHLRADVTRACEEQGKLLWIQEDSQAAGRPSGSWALMTLLIAQHCSPDLDLQSASVAALAIECVITALDLLDDAEDEDQTPIMRALGPARLLNVATALLMLAQRAILSLQETSLPTRTLLHLLHEQQEAVLVAAAGQHQDLLAEQRSIQDMTVEECLTIAAQKGGELMSLACRFGALYGLADDKMCQQFSVLGKMLGIAHQLDNDCHDLYHLVQRLFSQHSTEGDPIPHQIKTDLVRRKKTLPIILAAQAGRGMLPDENVLFSLDAQQKEVYQRLLHQGIAGAWGICLLYRERARDCLQQIELGRAVSPLLRLLLGFV